MAHKLKFFTPAFLVLLALLAGGLTACAPTNENYDKEAKLTRSDYEFLKSRRGAGADADNTKAPPIPALKPVIAAPKDPALADSRRVTINMTDETPLRDVLIEMARKAEVDLELDPRIRGGLIFSANDRPIKEVVERIANAAGLRYEFNNNTLRIELDEPYLETYRLDAINVIRTLSSSVAASTDVFTAVSGDTGSASGGNASTTSISQESKSDFWAELTASVEKILSSRPRRGFLSRQADPDTQPVAQQPAPQESTENSATPATAALQAMRGSTNQPQPAQKEEPQEQENEDYFTINRQAGIVSVYTTARQHRKVAEYLKLVQQLVSSQVLIEAKIVEVNLSEQFASGINWSKLGGSDDLRMVMPFGDALTFPPGADNAPTMAIALDTDGTAPMNGIINLISSFGTVRTLSSPRLTVMNNQVSILKVAENEVYFQIEIEREDLESGLQRATYTSTLNTVPIGLVMTVQPSIDVNNDKVTLSLRPTISRVARRVADPAVALSAADLNVDIESLIPVVEVRELDSVVTVNDGQVLIMGGLMQERVNKSDNGVPGLSKIPVAGNAFKSKNNQTSLTELVILLRTTIVQGNNSVHNADKDLYQRFTPDPRPLSF